MTTFIYLVSVVVLSAFHLSVNLLFSNSQFTYEFKKVHLLKLTVLSSGPGATARAEGRQIDLQPCVRRAVKEVNYTAYSIGFRA